MISGKGLIRKILVGTEIPSCFSDTGSMAPDARLAEDVLREYSNGLRGLEMSECAGLGISNDRCQILRRVLGRGAEGVITVDEKVELRTAGISEEFIRRIAGTDGKRALRNRVRWLADNIVTRWYRNDYEDHDRARMINEIASIGRDARASVPVLIENLQDSNSYIQAHAAEALGDIGPAASAAVPALGRAFEDGHDDVRVAVVRALGNIGPSAAGAMPVLKKALGVERPEVRVVAADALGCMGPSAIPVLEGVIEAPYRDEDRDVRIAATQALGNIGPSAVPVLIRALGNNHWRVGEAAVWALGRIGPSVADVVPALERRLEEPVNGSARVAAAEVLGNILGPDAVPVLIRVFAEGSDHFGEGGDSGNPSSWLGREIRNRNQERLEADIERATGRPFGEEATNEESYVREAVTRVLKKMGPAAIAAIPTLEMVLTYSESERECVAAVQALGEIGPAAIPVLARALENGVRYVRLQAVRTLGNMGPAASEAVPALMRVLSDLSDGVEEKLGDVDMFVAVTNALGEIGPAAREAVPSLIKTLVSPSISVYTTTEMRLAVVRALGQMGSAAIAAIPMLEIVLTNCGESERGCVAAAGALGNMGSEAIPVLRRALENENAQVMVAVARALGQIDLPAIPALTGVPGGGNAEARLMAVRALDEISSAGEEVFILIRALGYGEEVREAAARELGRIGPAAREAIPTLERTLGDENTKVRLAAAYALGRIGFASNETILTLTTALGNGDWEVRVAAARMLGEIGPAAREATPELERILRYYGDDRTREAATRALEQIRGHRTP